MDASYLGEFEQMVLLAVMRAAQTSGEAYGITVHRELTTHGRRESARGAVYMTLDRLEKKGLLSSFTTEPTAARGGRAKRCYGITKQGLAALRASKRTLERLWDGLESIG